MRGENNMLSSFNPTRETDRLINWLKETCIVKLKRDGGVIGLSGGIDSATVLYLTVKALGVKRVTAVFMPDKDSSPQSLELVNTIASTLGISIINLNITSVLDALLCYELRDNAVLQAVPGFDSRQDKFKIILPQNLLGEATLNIFSAIVIKPDGQQIRQRLTPIQTKEIIAASNLKQRTRMTILYYEAEKLNYAVIGTANKNEHDLGFFVKYGDGGTDIQPIQHLFKTQVYEIAKHLNVPDQIIDRPPTTDTYSAETTQEEFFYRLPFDLLDGIWQAHENQLTPYEIANRFNLTTEQIINVIADIQDKKRTTEYLRFPPLFYNND